MVRIEKVVLHGFKSFAGKTTLLFPSNFTVICGPNGSGKSNILDAICFVLGRSSAKRLRADRMHEMIFHGSKKRSAMDTATVSIYFENKDRKIPVEEDEVIITRKVNKKGISIYKLNGQTVTREKILEILRPAGIHPEGHNIILQGDITDVIEMSPIERREIIDEIAGIREFDEKREKAIRELEKVEERLKEAKIILGERFNILEKLKRESEGAKKYKSLSERIERLRASVVYKKLGEVEDAMSKLREKIKEKEEESKKVEEEFQKIEKEMESVEKELKAVEDKIIEKSKKISVIREIERLRSEIEKRKQKIIYNTREIERINDIVTKLSSIFEVKNRVVETVLNLGRAGVYGTVSQLMRVPPEYALAIEVAAGNHLNDIIVKDENVAFDCIRYLKQNKIGRTTFLPLNRLQVKQPREKINENGVIDFAINLIDFDEKYLPAFSFVFGDTLIVENLEVVKKIGFGRYRYVTLEGDLVEKSSAIVGGFYKEKPREIEEVKKYMEMKKALEEENKELEKEIEKLSIELENFSKIEIPEEDVSEVEKIRNDLRRKLEKIREKRRKVYERRVSVQTTLNRLNIQKARLEAELENIKIEFENYKNFEIIDAPVETLENELKKSIRELQNLGPVNMKAIEEYEEQKVVYEEMKQRVEVLEREREKVMETILEIEQKRKQVFYETLNGIREEFKKVFYEIAKGEADLVLEDPENIDSGLLIQASPRGKKLLNIDLLSGGEKSLTAIAFIFAIQRFKPAPFYILDEIEAALDKTNTKKIVELIKKYSKNSQFIIISHNDITIKSADCVYGVSMEDGESKIVAVRLPEE